MSDLGKRIPKKFTHQTPDEIEEFLSNFHRCVSEGRYSIALNEKRQQNVDFINDYKINTKKEKEILLGLRVEDFCYTTENEKDDFADEILYVFCKEQELDNWGTLETVDIYIKINMIPRGGDWHSVVVSFHKRNFEISHLFR